MIVTSTLLSVAALDVATKPTVDTTKRKINVSKMKPVKFSATRQEAEAYGMENDLSDIFSVKVHE